MAIPEFRPTLLTPAVEQAAILMLFKSAFASRAHAHCGPNSSRGKRGGPDTFFVCYMRVWVSACASLLSRSCLAGPPSSSLLRQQRVFTAPFGNTGPSGFESGVPPDAGFRFRPAVADSGCATPSAPFAWRSWRNELALPAASTLTTPPPTPNGVQERTDIANRTL